MLKRKLIIVSLLKEKVLVSKIAVPLVTIYLHSAYFENYRLHMYMYYKVRDCLYSMTESVPPVYKNLCICNTSLLSWN